MIRGRLSGLAFMAIALAGSMAAPTAPVQSFGRSIRRRQEASPEIADVPKPTFTRYPSTRKSKGQKKRKASQLHSKGWK